MAPLDNDSAARLDRLIDEAREDVMTLETEGISNGNRDFQHTHGVLAALERAKEVLMADKDPTTEITHAAIITRRVYLRVFGILKTPSSPARHILTFEDDGDIIEGRTERKIGKTDTGGDVFVMLLAKLFEATVKDGEEIEIIQRLEGTRTEICRAYTAYLREKEKSGYEQ